MKLHELCNNKITLEEILKFFNKTEETDDGYITWCDKKGTPHLQVNMYNQVVYILTDHFKNLLDLGDRVVEERKKKEHKKQFDPFYLEPKAKQVELGHNYQEHTEEEEKPKKIQRMLPHGERVNVDYVVTIGEYLTDHERDIFENKGDRGYVGYEHLLSENKPKYIDKYTTAYNSEIMRAILSHQ